MGVQWFKGVFARNNVIYFFFLFYFFERKECIVQGSHWWGVAITLQSEERNKVRRRRDYLPSLLPKGLEP